jgi:hypothetical protein
MSQVFDITFVLLAAPIIASCEYKAKIVGQEALIATVCHPGVLVVTDYLFHI